VLKLDDLEVGMELQGAVLYVVDFGAFVDIGMHDSGLVHISQISSRYVRDPLDVVSVGQIVKVWVLELDKTRRRVALTMIPPAEREQRVAEQSGAGRGERRPRRERGGSGQRPAEGAGAVAQQQARPQQARPQQQARGGGGDRNRPPREQQPKVYVAKGPKKPAAPISKAMKEGREPLRTFGDLKQFLESRGDESDETGDQPDASGPVTS